MYNKETMDNIPEREQPKAERIVSIGQEFPLFGPESVISTHPTIEHKISLFTLNIKNNLRIPLDVGLYQQGTTGQFIGFTPFEPELGYVTSPEDFNPETRRAKLERALNKMKLVNYSRQPFNLLILNVGKGARELNRIGINKKVYLSTGHASEKQEKNLVKKIVVTMQNVARLKKGDIDGRKHFYASYRFSQETLDIIKRLRLLLSFSTGSFAAQPNEIDLNHGVLTFLHFYPSDQGRFPKLPKTDDMYQGIHKGHFIFVPKTLGELSQIRARFVMVEEQSQGREV